MNRIQVRERPAGQQPLPEPGSVLLRPAAEQDAPAFAEMLRLLSPASAFMRFLSGLGEPPAGLVRALLASGPHRGAVLAVLAGGAVVGHACWSVRAGGVVDVGVVVLDGWQRRGLGRDLFEAALTRATTVGASTLHLDIHPENRRLVASLRRRLPTADRRYVDGLVSFDVPIEDVLGPAGRPLPDGPAWLLPGHRRRARSRRT